MKLILEARYWKYLVMWLVWVALPLLIGAVFYRYLRPEHAPFFGEVEQLESPFPTIISHSLPSLLWSFALNSSLMLIWKPKSKLNSVIITGATIIVSILFELWQAADVGIGTFDWNDCLFSVAGCLLSFLALYSMFLNENNN